MHTLVALAFLGEPPGPIGKAPGEYQADHKNGDKWDNTVKNLEWVTNQENMRRASINGQLAHGGRNGHAKLTEEQRKDILHLAKQGMTFDRIAVYYHVDSSTISRMVKRKTWRFSD